MSYSQWELSEQGARVEVRLAQLDLSLAGTDPLDGPAVAAYVTGHLSAGRSGRPCSTGTAHVNAASEGFLLVRFELACGGPPDTIVSRLFDEVAPSHLHFTRMSDAGRVAERVLTLDDPAWSLSRPMGSSFADYLWLGIDHIRSGYDHLAFVIALLLLAASLGEVLRIVTAFTVAHSLTLAAAVVGVVHPAPAAVEALIGFSIALVAVENGWQLAGRDRATPWLVAVPLAAAGLLAPGQVGLVGLFGVALFASCHLALLRRSERPARVRALIAFGFGLVHGFGFAGVLAELDLPRGRLVPALVGFNLGVEAGQLVVVATGWIILVALERIVPGARRRVAECGSATVLALGLFWFITRGWG